MELMNYCHQIIYHLNTYLTAVTKSLIKGTWKGVYSDLDFEVLVHCGREVGVTAA